MCKKIVFFDSGIGGLSTLATCLKICPSFYYEYIADTLHAPYGKLPASQVTNFSYNILSKYFNNDNIDAIVVACNTATNCAIEVLRKQTKTPIIGIEPAILPALHSTQGKILVLATPTTLTQPKFLNLAKPFKNRLILSPQPHLATLIESFFQRPSDSNLQIIKNTLLNLKHTLSEKFSAIVLGCTHYSLIAPIIQQTLNINVFDGNIGVAQALCRCLNTHTTQQGSIDPDIIKHIFHSSRISTTSPTTTDYLKILKDLLKQECVLHL